MPNLAAISCNTMVAIIESSIAHNKLKPKLTPANVQSVTVPGPIKAAATKVPGPIFLKYFFSIRKISRSKTYKVFETLQDKDTF